MWVGKRVAIGLLALIVAGSGAPAVLARSSQDAGIRLTTTPVDQSGLEFRAIRAQGAPIVPGQAFWLEVRRTVETGPLHFAELVDGSPVDLGSVSWTDGGSSNGTQILLADLEIPAGTTKGSHTYQAIFDATATVDALTLELTLDVEPVATSVSISTPLNPAQTHHDIILSAEISSVGTGAGRTGQLEWRDADTDTVLKTAVADDDWQLTLSNLPVGIHHYVVAFAGDETHAASTSLVYALTVVPDVVEITSLGVSPSTIYPVRDGFRDYARISGNRLEPISVTIAIYNSTNHRVYLRGIAAATGPYSITWTGRSSTGSILAAGRYRVVQTLRDSAGMTRVWSAYAYISLKKLVTKTAYITKLGKSITAANGRIYVSSTGYAKLVGSLSTPALAGYQFSLPSAVIYKSIAFGAYGKAPFYAPPRNFVAMQNFGWCPSLSGDWNTSCFDQFETFGGTLGWHSTSGSPTWNRRSRTARGMVEITAGTVIIYKVRIRVVYQILQ